VSRHTRLSILLALTALFAFRLLYGLSMPFWYEDERQVYLIGLQAFARSEWPYFGADVVWTGGQVPGALLGWLIRLPLELWSAPESPVVFLNVLSFAALTLLAWYLSRRLPGVPRWLIWMSLFTLPWTLNFSTHIVNPSYVLAGAVVFFVGFFEAMPQLSRRLFSLPLAWSMMGAGLLFVMQLHMSWVLLVPYVLTALISIAVVESRPQAIGSAITGFVAGAAVPGILLAPTFLRFGWRAGSADSAVVFHGQDPFEIVTTAARVLSFASFEVNRFIGMSTAERLLVFSRHPIVALAAVPVAIAAVVHPIWMAVSAFRRSAQDGAAALDWTRVRLLMLGTIVLITASYYFSVRGPQAHSFYVVLPVSALFAFTWWDARARAAGRPLRRLERVALTVIVANIVLHAGLGIDRLHRQSLYVDRNLVAAAITDRNDRYLGDRRDTALGQQFRELRRADQVTDVEAYKAATATADLQISAVTWKPLADRMSSFDLTVQNRSRTAAWLDIRLSAAYTDPSGAALDTREVVIKQILQPGESRRWTGVADGWIPEGASAATMAIVGAEKVIPARRQPY
jgi:hypothetical protein